MHGNKKNRTHKGGTDMDMINYVSSISSSVNEWLGDYRATERLLSIDAGDEVLMQFIIPKEDK